MPQPVRIGLGGSHNFTTGIGEHDFQFKILVKDSSCIKLMLYLKGSFLAFDAERADK